MGGFHGIGIIYYFILYYINIVLYRIILYYFNRAGTGKIHVKYLLHGRTWQTAPICVLPLQFLPLHLFSCLLSQRHPEAPPSALVGPSADLGPLLL